MEAHEQKSMKYLLGKKIEMTQVFREDGSVVPATLVAVEPCVVAALREDQQGNKVAMIGTAASEHVAKPQLKQFGDKGSFKRVAQVRLRDGETPEVGQVLTVSTFVLGDKVDAIGTSKGRGFQGVVKRHGFRGHPTTHGHKDQVRKSGSIGAGGIQRVFKGMRMAGRMGSDRVTVQNLEVVSIDTEKNVIGIKGAIPGARGSEVTLIATNGNVWQN
ncbi:MAG: large subunit ribosomal protein [Patescibacteria group bacterium]|nr:large subunit ribosomal protein [Patescibacteria group bacterium]